MVSTCPSAHLLLRGAALTISPSFSPAPAGDGEIFSFQGCNLAIMFIRRPKGGGIKSVRFSWQARSEQGAVAGEDCVKGRVDEG